MNNSIFKVLILPLILGAVFLNALSYALVKSEKYFDARTGKYVDVAKGQIIVKFKPAVSFQSVSGFNARNNLKIIKELPQKMRVLASQKTVNPPSVEILLDAYRKDPSVEYAEPNYIVHAMTTTPNDPSYSLQWALPKIKANLGWDLEKGSSNVTIAVVDTGVSMNHSDLSGNIWNNQIENAAGKNNNGIDDDGNRYTDDYRGWDFVNGDNNPDDDNGHGTHVSGIAAAVSNNSVGIAGVAWNCKIMAIKVLDADGRGYLSDMIEGVIYAANNGAQVINISLGGPSRSETENTAMQAARGKGCVIIAAAGNDGDTTISYPASYSSVISVGSVDKNDNVSYFSNYNAYVDVCAPGGSGYYPLADNIYSSWISNSYEYEAGTSMATPFVSGLAALLFSRNPAWTNTQVEDQILNTADHLGTSGRNDYYGYGRINVARALDSTPPSITLSSFDGGNYIPGGKIKNITWTASDEGFGIGQNGIAIYYSTDGGSTYPNVIASSIENSGSYSWTTPAIESASARLRIVAQDLIGNIATRESSGNFVIDSTPPSISLTSLNGGQNLSSSDIENITWTATDENSGIPPAGISIYYSIDGGSTFQNTIAGSVENTGSYLWTVPTIESNAVRIRIIAQDRAGNFGSSESSTNINVRSVPPPSPTVNPVTSPTNVSSIKLSGWKSLFTQAIMINGNSSGVTYPSQTSWECTVPLSEGLNTFEITARDSLNNESIPSIIRIVQKILDYNDSKTGASVTLPIGSSADTPIVTQEVFVSPQLLGNYPAARTMTGNAVKFNSSVTNFTKPISITMKIGANAIHPAPYYWDDSLKKWSSSGIVTTLITASSITFTTTHFSIYAVFDVTGIISDILVYPNPYKIGTLTGVIFDGLKGDEKIRIYTVTGELVASHQVSGVNVWAWNTITSYGRQAAKDVYIYLITNSLGQKKIGKIIVVN